MHSGVLLRYPVQRHPLTNVFWGEMKAQEGRHDVFPPSRKVSHIDPLRVQARSERAVENPEVTRHRVRRHGTL